MIWYLFLTIIFADNEDEYYCLSGKYILCFHLLDQWTSVEWKNREITLIRDISESVCCKDRSDLLTGLDCNRHFSRQFKFRKHVHDDLIVVQDKKDSILSSC
jgi:hypothetical protein